MVIEAIALSEFLVAGICVRTTNDNGQSQKDIGDLWSRFHREKIIVAIPNKVSSDIYCIYTDYENESNGFYTTIVGCKVSAIDHLPAELTGRIIAANNYRKYISIGKIPESVIATWMEIWQSGLSRTFLADFDVYGDKSKDMDIAEVETYVSLQ